MIEVVDRVAQNPGQFTLHHENGTEETVTLERNDNPVVPGTPINKALFDSIKQDIENAKADSDLTTNLLKPTIQTQTQGGVTLTNNGDGTFTVNGTATADLTFTLFPSDIFPKGKYKILGCPKNGSTSTYRIRISDIEVGGYNELGDGVVVNLTSGKIAFSIIIKSGYTCNNLVFKPMITTNLNATYEDFVPYTGDTGKLNGDVANLTRDVLSIAELKMLGWNVPKEFPIQNEVNGNQFIQRVGRLDLSNLVWGTGSNNRFLSNSLNEILSSNNIYCYGYRTATPNEISGGVDKTIGYVLESSYKLQICDKSYSDVYSFRNGIKGRYLYYELATPITKTIDGNEALFANGVSFVFDYKDGKYGFNTNPNRGADTFVPFKAIDLVGSYAGNQTINVSQYLKSGDTADNFIIELISIASSSGSTGLDSYGTTTWGNSISIGARTISKAISGTNLVISNATIGASCGSTSREWSGTKANASCTSNISYRVWYKG